MPTPLVFGIHGYTSSAEEHQLVTNLDQVAEDRGVLVVYPQALNNDWFPGHVPANNLDYLLKVYDETVAVRECQQRNRWPFRPFARSGDEYDSRRG